MRGKIITKILEFISDEVIGGNVDLIESILVSGYGASYGKIDYEYRKRRESSEKEKNKKQEYLEKKNRLNKFLYKLKKDGLIKEDLSKDSGFSITHKGKIKLKEIKNKNLSVRYEKEVQERATIISFDIPEEFRNKRLRFREIIKSLGFEMVHQSFWVGNTKIPKQLIVDLEDMGILKYIEILEVNKSGSLEKLVKKS